MINRGSYKIGYLYNLLQKNVSITYKRFTIPIVRGSLTTWCICVQSTKMMMSHNLCMSYTRGCVKCSPYKCLDCKIHINVSKLIPSYYLWDNQRLSNGKFGFALKSNKLDTRINIYVKRLLINMLTPVRFMIYEMHRTL